MKHIVLITLLLSVTLYGCETLETDAQRGAAGGALAGAALGGIIGHQDDDHGAEGALIGAAVGALGGGLVGKSIDNRNVSPSSARYISVVDVVDMAQKGVPGNIIIDEIERTESTYDLNLEQIDYMKHKGVDGFVIDYMLQTM